MRIQKQSAPGVAALRRAGEDESLLVASVWMEALEARVMFAATAATLALDRGFGVGGFMPGTVTTVAAGTQGDSYAVISPAGDGNFELVRFDSHARLDTRFDQNAQQVITGSTDYLYDLELHVQADDKVVVATNGVDGLVFYRLNRDGTSDMSFGAGGKASIAFPHQETFQFWFQPDGKLTVIYTNRNSEANLTAFDEPVICRLNQNGTADLSFGTGGVRPLLLDSDVPVPTLTNPNTEHFIEALSAVQLPDGSVVAYLHILNAHFVFSDPLGISAFDSAVEQVRLDSNGNEISVSTVLRQEQLAYPTTLEEPDGSLLNVVNAIDGSSTMLFRYAADGTPDTTFGVNGALSVALLDGIAVQPDGKIVISIRDPDGPIGFDQVSGLQRLNPDGSPDLTFAKGQAAYDERIYRVDDIFLLSNGFILAQVVKQNPANFSDDESVEFALIQPMGGLPNTFDLVHGPDGTSASDALFGASLSQHSIDSGGAATYRGLFATAPGASLFDPEGKRDVFGETVG